MGAHETEDDAPADLKTFLQQLPSPTKKEIPAHSHLWANIAKPFAKFIFFLVFLVILLPFLFICFDTEQKKEYLDWARVVWAPVVGFCSAVVGYYFGTRNSHALGSDNDNEGES